MSAGIEPPIFFIEGRDLAVFESLGDAERHLEAPYLGDSSVEALDSRGQRLSVDAVGTKVIFSLDEDTSPNPAKLEAAIRDYLIAIGDKRVSDQACDLPCLIQLSISHATKSFSPRRFLRRGGG